ncbi:MAG: FxsA family protein [Fuerstiella sp.]|nr:FxsA family protein [Fuerstiella sp.]
MKTQSVSISLTGRLLLAFILVPLIELTLLHQLYLQTSFMTTLLVVVFTGILGVSLARRQGLSVWRGIHRQLAEGKNPSVEIVNGVMILLAGAFLMTPGMLTDAVGFALLVPWIRNRLRVRLTDWFRKRTMHQFGGSGSSDEFRQHDTVSESRPSVRVVDPLAEKFSTGDLPE